MNFQPPKGTTDISHPESGVWRSVLRSWEHWSELYGYPLILTPIFESTDLFERGVGGTTEVVTKQMYTFKDKKGRSITLRPEGTAGVVRAFLDSGGHGPWKAAYSGAMFRYEQPQKGRSREFYQVGVEYLDVESPLADVEVIELGMRFIKAVGVDDLELRINSLGDPNCRPGYIETLSRFFGERKDQLCDESRQLVEVNPLRILDCKVCQSVAKDAPAMSDFLCGACAGHHQVVKDGLTALGVDFVEDPSLVRGLDYYTRTAFEYIGTGLDAAQNAVGGGGRYDGLAEAIGGRAAPGVGFALGIGRIILAMADPEGSATVAVFVVSEVGPEHALRLVSDLRNSGISTDFDPEGKSLKAQFRAAARSDAPISVIFHGRDQDVSIRKDDERYEVPLKEVSQWLTSRK